MRIVNRVALPRKASKWLLKNQGQLAGDITIKVSSRWRERRQTMNNNGIVDALRRMAGIRHRCMYCGDSEGCDIEHYYPKSDARWRGRVFDWDNFLWICAPCNRLKNAAFEVDAAGVGVLINPSIDSVWNFFDYVEESGQLVPRCDLPENDHRRAQITLREDLTRLLHEVICDSRLRAVRAMRRAISTYNASAHSLEDQEEFFLHILDAGHPELCDWYFSGLGAQLLPFSLFSTHHGALVTQLRVRINNAYPGVW